MAAASSSTVITQPPVVSSSSKSPRNLVTVASRRRSWAAMAFDPYSEWLHVPADRRPPTWYDLLGLPPGETDPEAIVPAVKERYDRLRNYASGPLGDQANRILDELAEARLTLTDREKKFRYDGSNAVPATAPLIGIRESNAVPCSRPCRENRHPAGRPGWHCLSES